MISKILGKQNTTLYRLTRKAGLIGCLGLICSLALAQPGEPTVPESQPAVTSAPTAVDAQAAIIPIHKMIDDVAVTSLKRRAEQALTGGATILILELDTPGGLVSSAVEMCKYLRNLAENKGIKTVAWVKDEAISGGTMVSMACDEIIMSRNSLIGDCGVIMIGLGGASTAQDPALDAKIESYVLSVFDSAASRNGYDPLLCDSFVRYEVEVWWLENTVTGERRFVDTAEKEDLLGEKKSKDWTSRLLESSRVTKWQLVKNYIDPLDGKEKRLRQPVISDTKLLTIDQSMASVLGFCKKIIRDVDELKPYYGLSKSAEVPRMERSWSEDLVSWLTSPMVRMFLIAMIGLGAYTEFHSPGVGLPGLVAVIALVIFLGAPYLAGLANAWEIVIVLLGIALIFAEIFLIPGFGLAGIAGVVLLVVGLLATFMPEEPGKLPIYWPEMPQSFEGLKTGIRMLALGLALSLAGMVALSRIFPQIPYLKNIAPANPTAEGVLVADPYEGLASVGDVGLAESPLRPAGKARFGSKLVDVVTEGELLEPHTKIEVIERRGNRVVVRKVS